MLMVEFCLECLNKLDERNYSKDDYIISTELDLCEGCGEWKHIVIMKRYHNNINIFLPFEIIIGLFRIIINWLIKIINALFLWHTKRKSKKKDRKK